MKLLKIMFNSLLIAFCLHFGVSTSFADDDSWRKLLAENVSEGLVDYHGIHKNLSMLDDYLLSLKEADITSMSNDEQLAYYINAYNGCTIKLIIDNHRVKDGQIHFVESIKDIGSFFSSPWKIRFCNLGEEQYTLDELEHEIIREKFDDPRVHFALNCASKSCPPLMDEPYQADKLDLQLDRQTRLFINDSKNNYLKNNTLYLSKVFDWYEEDFQTGVVPFFVLFAEGDLKDKLERAKDQPKIEYLRYDWSLNIK